jgi:hypothetical protein
MANFGGQMGWDDVTIVGKRGPKTGTTLKSEAAVLAAQRKGLAVETEKKCKLFYPILMILFLLIFIINLI